MKRIDQRTVELTQREMNASHLFEQRLDAGDNIDQAIAYVQRTYWWAELSDEFIEWLR